MATYILDKAYYEVTDVGGVPAHRVVIQGAQAGHCRLPVAENARALGVTVHAQSLQKQNVAVRKAGIARVEAGGPIGLADAVFVLEGGYVVSMDNDDPPNLPAGTKINCLGFAETAANDSGDIIEVFISMHERTM